MIERYARFSASVSNIYQYIQKIESEEMKNIGLKGPYAQYLVAMTQSENGITSTELCQVCSKDKAAVSRSISQMTESGLVYREGDGNRYRQKIKLTEKGLESAKLVCEKASRAVEFADKGFEEKDREKFYEILDLLAENLRKLSDSGIASFDKK